MAGIITFELLVHSPRVAFCFSGLPLATPAHVYSLTFLLFLRKPPAFHRSKLLLKSVLLLFRKHLLLVGVNDWACWKCNNEPLDYLTHNSSTKQFFFTSI